jgi:ankyrin repeat protein
MGKIVVRDARLTVRRGLLMCVITIAVGWVRSAQAGPTEDLFSAAERGDAAAAQAALNKGARVNAQRHYIGAPIEVGDEYSALIVASRKVHLEVVKLLLHKGSKINATTTHYRFAALIEASGHGQLAVVKTLLANGAEVNAKNIGAWTALSLASGKGHLEVVKTLLKQGADVNVKSKYSGTTALTEAFQNGHLAVVAQLANDGHGWGNTGATALMKDCASGDSGTALVPCLVAFSDAQVAAT